MQLRQSNKPRVRRYFVVGPTRHGTDLVVHNPSLANSTRALLERVLFLRQGDEYVPTPKPTVDVNARLAQFGSDVARITGVHPRLSYAEFVSRYNGRRRHVYEAAAERLLAEGPSRARATLTSFVKAEKVLVNEDKPDPVPRLIQPRTPEYNIAVGVHISHLEKPIYRAIGEIMGGPTVMKGCNAKMTAKHIIDAWESFSDPVALDMDASRFDQHVSVDMLEWEHSVYLRCVPYVDRGALKELLQKQLRNVGRIVTDEGTIKYSVSGCRMSGDMNTALGNCLISCALGHTFLMERGVCGRFFNNGDDCVIICERKDLRKLDGIANWYRKFGFSMKVGSPVFEPEQIEFCQTRPVWTPNGWVMVRDPLKALAKDSTILLPITGERYAMGWYTAVGECGLALTGGIPVFQEFYRSFLRSGCGVRIRKNDQMESGFFHLAAGMDRAYGNIHPRTRYSFWRAFGILPHVQLTLEEHFRSQTLNGRVSQGKVPTTLPDELFTRTW